MRQDVILTDDSISSNIAFGISAVKVDADRVLECLDIVGLKEYVAGLNDGLATKLGEKGKKLSGGQRQRIGIARALYNNPTLLVLDEATSALDIASENRIIEKILHLKKKCTLIVISHKPALSGLCDKHIRVAEGRIRECD